MSEADGQIRIKVNVDSSEVNKDMEKLQNKLSKQTESLQRQEIIVEKLTARYEALYEKAKETAIPNLESDKILKEIESVESALSRLSKSYKEAKLVPNAENSDEIQKILNEYDKLNRKLSELKNKHQEVQFSPDMQNKLHSLGKEIDLAIEKEKRLTNEVNNTKNSISDLQNQKVTTFQNNFDKVSKSLEAIRNNVKKAQESTANFTGKIQEIGQSIGGAFESAGSKIVNFVSSIWRLASSVLVFNMISSAFSEMARGIQNVIMSDSQLSSSLAQVKANLWTAFYPIYQAILPALQALGRALSWITGKIASFIAMLTGTSVKANQAGAKAMALQTQNVGKSSQALGKGTKNVHKNSKAIGKQAKNYDKVGKSAKKAKRELASFDKIEVLSQKHLDKGAKPNSPDVGGGSAPDTGGFGAIGDTIDGFNQSLEEFNFSPLNMIIEKFKEFAKVFEKGFDMGFVDRNFDDILNNLQRIQTVMQRIFNDPKVIESFNKSLYSIVETLGTITGAFASVGVTSARLLTGAIANFLEENEDRIKNSLIRCFDITTKFSDFIAQFARAFANIFEVFGGEEAKSTLSNVFSSLYALFDTHFTNLYALSVDTAVAMYKPFVTYQDSIKEMFRGILESASGFTNGIKKICQKLSDTMTSIYNHSISPLIETFGEIWSDTYGMIVNSWNKHINPVLKQMAQRWDDTIGKHINPMIETLGKTVNKFYGEMRVILKNLWESLKPFLSWLVDNFFKVLGRSVVTLWNIMMEKIGYVADGIRGLYKSLKGFVDMVVGLLRGDWQRAWDGAGKAVLGMVNVVKSALNMISSSINGLLDLMFGAINAVIRGLNRFSFNLPDFLGGGHVGFSIPEIPKSFSRIPRLQQGAVLDGGNPYLAWVNDQPRGQTNVETPLSTMIEAFKSAMGSNTSQNIVIEANGDFNQFIRFLNFKLKQEESRIGQSFVTGDSWI